MSAAVGKDDFSQIVCASSATATRAGATKPSLALVARTKTIENVS